MSDNAFPILPGLTWSTTKKPIFSSHVSQHVSGREIRVSNYANPLYQWQMSYEFLRADSHVELQTLMAFFMTCRGSFDTFLYQDPSETNQITAGAVGTGDGVKTTFILTKSFGGFTEPVAYVYGTPAVHVYFTVSAVTTEQFSGWSITQPNKLIFTSAPASGTIITATYKWAYRVRFGEDSQDYENFMYQLWTLKKLSIQSVKP